MIFPLFEALEVTDLEEEVAADVKDQTCETDMHSLTDHEKLHFTSRLMEAFWRLHAAKPANPMLAPVCLPGIVYE